MSDSISKSVDFLLKSEEFIELKPQTGLTIDLRYASTNNFVGYDMYGPRFRRAFLHRIAGEMLFSALQDLRGINADYGFIIFDALRPRSIQRILWDRVRGTEGEKYIANPDRGSLHNYGFAVDLSILDEQGRELDMGAGFDDFRPIAQPQLEERFRAEGLLTDQHLRHRELLRGCMQNAGFRQLPHEWWHFDAMPRAEVNARYRIVE